MLKLNLPSQNPIVILLIVIVLALAGVPSYYFYNQYQKAQMLLKNPTEAAKQEVRSLVGKVGKHIELPNEEPTVATVSDKEKLKDQPFFQKAENGDKVLIYTQARKAILYRPSTNKIIEVSTVNIGGAAGSSTVQTNSPAKVAIYNGTNIAGLAKTVEQDLLGKGLEIEITNIDDAKKKDYTDTIIVDLTGKQKAMSENLAAILNGKTSSLPQGEIKPQADILIIVGK